MLSLLWGGAHEVLGRGAIFRAAPPSESVVLGHIGNFCTVVPTKPWFCGMIGHIQENLCVVPRKNFAMGRAREKSFLVPHT